MEPTDPIERARYHLKEGRGHTNLRTCLAEVLREYDSVMAQRPKDAPDEVRVGGTIVGYLASYGIAERDGPSEPGTYRQPPKYYEVSAVVLPTVEGLTHLRKLKA